MIQNTEIFDLLIEHIIKIYDENDNEISYNKISYKIEKRKYSITYSLVFYIDDKPLSVKQFRTYKVLYKCRCNRENKIYLVKYMQKPKLYCQHCSQDRSFSDYIIAHTKNKVKKEKVQKIYKFDEMDESFYNWYFKSHLTEKEFYNYIKYFYKINNTIITDYKKVIYYVAEPIKSQYRFTAKVSFDNGKTKETIKNVYLKCKICQKIFKIHIYNMRNKDLNNIICKSCSFTNLSYPIQLYDNTGLTYQSGIEYNFITNCLQNNIKITNGLTISYQFNNKIHKYITDFYLPEYQYIVELKSKNKFYRDDKKSGKLYAKNNAAELFCKQNNMNFKFVFDYEINDFINKLLSERDDLNSIERQRS